MFGSSSDAPQGKDRAAEASKGGGSWLPWKSSQPDQPPVRPPSCEGAVKCTACLMTQALRPHDTGLEALLCVTATGTAIPRATQHDMCTCAPASAACMSAMPVTGCLRSQT